MLLFFVAIQYFSDLPLFCIVLTLFVLLLVLLRPLQHGNHDAFVEAQTYIYRAICNDILPRFITSENFTSMAKEKADLGRKAAARDNRDMGWLYSYVQSSDVVDDSGSGSASGNKWSARFKRGLSSSSLARSPSFKGDSPRSRSKSGNASPKKLALGGAESPKAASAIFGTKKSSTKIDPMVGKSATSLGLGAAVANMKMDRKGGGIELAAMPESKASGAAAGTSEEPMSSAVALAASCDDDGELSV